MMMNSVDIDTEMKSKPVVWTPNLHTRFVECILILGPRGNLYISYTYQL